MSISTTDQFDPFASWCLNPQVSLRDESFGALAYHHGTRRLVFLKSRELVELVRALETCESAEAAIGTFAPVEQHDRYLTALSSLARSEILSER